MKRILAAFIVIVLTMLGTAACGGSSVSAGQAQENKQQAQDSKSLLLAQPIPHYNYSQIRQNLIELETAQANGVQTTSFFFNQGVRDPVQACPSIGAPIPTTTQLTNPQQVYDGSGSDGGGNVPIGQMDPNGTYSGNSSGTYVMCVGADGKPYADYWEGFVQTIFGPASWNYSTHQAQLLGPPSFKFSK